MRRGMHLAWPDAKKALQWGAFFVVWAMVASVQAELCRQQPDTLLEVKVSRVVDGDTLQLQDATRVRLIGLDTPEIGRDGKPSQPWAQAAKRRLQSLVDSGEHIYLLPGEQARDRYGRLLAHAFDAQGDNIEARLLQEGLGFAVIMPPNAALADCHMRAEQRARSERTGLWSGSPVRQARQVDAGGFTLVRGRINKVERTRDWLWLELDGPLVLRIATAELANWPALQWHGLDVEVRGWLIDRGANVARKGRKRYMLTLTHPLMLKGVAELVD